MVPSSHISTLPLPHPCTSHKHKKHKEMGMAKAGRILRKTIHAFLRSYQSYTSIAALLVFPVAVVTFFSQALVLSSPSLVQTVRLRVIDLFTAAGFPVSAGLFSLLATKLSQTMFSLAITIPFVLTFLVLGKAGIIQTVFQSRQNREGPPSFRCFLHLYIPLLQTCMGNYLIILSANAVVFCILFVAFNIVSVLQLMSSTTSAILSVLGGIIYSIVMANVVVACNLATVITGFNKKGGCLQILKAFLLLKGRTSTALSLAVVANLGMAAIEALFQHRVTKAYLESGGLQYSTAWEAFLIAYMYSVAIVLDTIASCMLLKSCKLRDMPVQELEVYQQANQLLEMSKEDMEHAFSKC